MEVKSPMINCTKQLIGEYSISISLTKDMQISLNRTLNELYILDLIYDCEEDSVKKIIDREILGVQKKIKESMKASSGFFGRLVGWGASNPISIGHIWQKLNEEGNIKKYRHLVTKIASLHPNVN